MLSLGEDGTGEQCPAEPKSQLGSPISSVLKVPPKEGDVSFLCVVRSVTECALHRFRNGKSLISAIDRHRHQAVLKLIAKEHARCELLTRA